MIESNSSQQQVMGFEPLCYIYISCVIDDFTCVGTKQGKEALPEGDAAGSNGRIVHL